MTEWLTVWLMKGLTEWLMAWLTEWSTEWLTVWWTEWSTVLSAWMTVQVTERLSLCDC